ncbi:MAG TPA: leucyl/phenylalanyl-tRNA--protein transferase [Gammaproteobacteria bacterium]|nr:leucyl/phenylalanyl-tRNA--protein transferase [Gammaproteobacteria bacterium]
MTQTQGPAPCWLDPDDPELWFPNVELALQEPDGLLAVGGDLSEDRLLLAYRSGIFPWYGSGQPILWWSPDPRLVLFPNRLRVTRSLARRIRKAEFTPTLDQAFDEVISACAEPRPGQAGTWITPEMITAYRELHASGSAHSVECWQDGRLVGGLYGVAIGRIFFGESMFARSTDASKVAFVALVRQLSRWGFLLIDCQVHTTHLASLGAETVPRREFIRTLEHACIQAPSNRSWRLDPDILSI